LAFTGKRLNYFIIVQEQILAMPCIGGAKRGRERANDPSGPPKDIGKINYPPGCDQHSKGLGK
jgi:hypothetical protein